MKLAYAVFLVPLLHAQPESDYRIKTTAELVLLDVAVENSHGQHVGDLTQSGFRVYEDGKLQTITYFSGEDVPVTVGIAVDQSGSMRSKRQEVINAATTFVRASNPQDKMFVVNFNDKAGFGLPADYPFTDKVWLLENAISSADAEGRTALNDAVILALDHASEGPNRRRAILLLSDGGDNASKHNEKELMESAEQVQATIYTIGLFSPDDPDKNPGLLNRLSTISGGERYLPEEGEDLSKVLGHIAREIRSRYTIAYVPSRAGGNRGGVRKIKVEAVDSKGSKLVVRTRTRYSLPESE